MTVKLSTPLKLTLMSGLMHGMFFIPMAMAYYSLKGADIAGFLLLQGLFRVAILVLEIPTGYLADRLHRHTQILVATALWCASMVLLFMADDYAGLVLAEMVGAAAIALNSGTIQAYMHEALAQKGQSKMQATWQGRLLAAQTATELVASMVGGWLFTQWIEAPVVASIACTAGAVMVALSLPNVPRQKGQRRHENPWKDMALVVHHSLRKHPRLPALLIGPWVLFGLTGVLFWVMLERLGTQGLSPTVMGVTLAAYMGAKTCISLASGRIVALGLRVGVVGMVLCLSVGTVLILSPSPWLVWLGGVLASGLVHGAGRPIAITLINAEVPDHERATVLSVASMVTQIGSGVLLLAAPLTLSMMSINAMMFSYLALTLLVAGYPLWRIVRA